MFILVDDEDRENEGDVVIPAQFATPSAINFMARYACGLICLAMTRRRVEELGLPPMSHANRTRHQTAFTVSIEAREGVTTGISAHDRAHTIAVAINPECSRDALITPGHMFPLTARDGGVLVRPGHTEAAVDIARLAGLLPAGAICEVMNEDGTMARLPDLVTFAQRHSLKLGTIADLIAYRRRTERLVYRVQECASRQVVGGEWRLIVYASTVYQGEHLALVKGDLSGGGPVPVCLQAIDVLDEITGCLQGLALEGAMRLIGDAGRGALVLTRESRPTALSERVRALAHPTPPSHGARDPGLEAQILVDLGIKEILLLSDHRRAVDDLEACGVKVVEQRPVGGTIL
jgi:3,4-dihydroxy 2-butanone 4-phosphate synthase/GTP cyclohydrolase II